MKYPVRTAIAASLLLAGVTANASDYYVVTPVKGRTVNTSAIQVTLGQVMLADAKVGAAYTYDFKPNLQVLGDAAYTGFGVSWAVASGSLPAGLTLNASTGVLSGTPTAAGTSNFTVSATYKTKPGSQGYQVVVANAQAIVALAANTDTNFGAVSVGSTASKAFTFSNTGGSAATGVYAEVAGAGVSLGTPNNCGTQASPVTVAEGSYCQVMVKYTPGDVGTLQGALVRVNSSAATSPSTLALTGSAVDPYDANVTLKLNFNGTDNSTTVVDASPAAKTLTLMGAARLTSTTYKAGGTSFRLNPDGVNTNYAVVSSAAIPASGPFTFEAWVYTNYSGSDAQAIYNQYENGTATRTVIVLDPTTRKFDWGHGQGPSLVSVNSVPLNTWTHVAITRDSANTLRMFVGGKLEASLANYTYNIEQSRPWIGRFNNISYSGAPFRGYIDELRITAGVARYTADFTPPSGF